MSDSDIKNSDRPLLDEIEITPAMIEAGADAIASFGVYSVVGDYGHPPDLAIAVYRAMYLHRKVSHT